MSKKPNQVYYVGSINPHTKEMLLSISMEDNHRGHLEKSTSNFQSYQNIDISKLQRSISDQKIAKRMNANFLHLHGKGINHIDFKNKLKYRFC